MADRPRVEISGTQAHGVIRGRTTPGVSVEAMNVSLSPRERVRPYEGVVIARADDRGRFVGKLPMRADDLLRVRARGPSGAAGPWTTFRARGVDGRPRGPNVAVFRIGLRDLENGFVKIFNLSAKRPIAEPGAALVVVNTRSDERVKLVMNASGSIAGRARVVGRAGDVLRVETKDVEIGTLTTPSPAPKPGLVATSGWHRKIGFVPDARPFDAPLFAMRPHPYDVMQSELQNCYLASAAATIAHVRPAVIERAITRLRDGRFRVRLKLGRKYVPHDVVVTPDLTCVPRAISSMGRAARHGGPCSRRRSPRCAAVIDASVAAGPPIACSSSCLDVRRVTSSSCREKPRPRGARLRARAATLPVVAGTSPPWTAKKFHFTGIVPDHAYAVLGCRAGYVTIRNPRGEDVGPPERPRRNGAFEISVDELGRYFQVVSTVR